jgi:diaminohydroxyphosphoribosylaminopyrimidine deaminase/5-amino-6-(5-phosphoribosylamino)uracil reductase
VLTSRVAYRHRPLIRVVFDRRLRTPPNAAIFSTLASGPVIVATDAHDAGIADRAKALEAVGAVIARVAKPEPFVPAVLRHLAARGVTSMIVEGGPTLHEAFLRAGVVDRVQLFVSPDVVGAGGVDWTSLPVGTIAALDDLHAVPVGVDVLVEGLVKQDRE